ncbi:MAG: multicopper oxidase family protein, partial [Actinomycetota bacterium]
GPARLTPHGRAAQKSGSELLHAASLKKFVDPLPIPPVARPAGVRPSPADARIKLPYYHMPLRELAVKVHRDVPSTRVWGVAGISPGPTFEARTGHGVLVEWANELPHKHLLAIDHAVHGAGTSVPDVRTVMHLHGGRTPPESDGYPEAWHTPGKSVLYHYPNHQDAAMLWYHDHALGITRLNVFAGLLGMYFVRDSVEDALPLPRGKYEVPLVVCDRAFTRHGQFAYPAKWKSEFAGDAVLVNGKIFPYLEVEPRAYRLRVLNAANSRAFDFTLSNKQNFHQIGTEQGLLTAPVELGHIALAPGERADLFVDFSNHAGEKIVLQDDNAESEPALMQFRVARSGVSQKRGTQHGTALPATLRPVHRMAESLAVRTRTMMLNDVIVNSDVPVAMLLNNTDWGAPVTEKPVLNSVEIWELANVTDEMHPIHLHLARFQVLDRRRFDVLAFQEKKVLHYGGPALPPERAESGWKDTVQAPQGFVTRIIARFEGYAGRYVWHCHILEHEDNQMMRPFDVVAG